MLVVRLHDSQEEGVFASANMPMSEETLDALITPLAACLLRFNIVPAQ